MIKIKLNKCTGDDTKGAVVKAQTAF